MALWRWSKSPNCAAWLFAMASDQSVYTRGLVGTTWGSWTRMSAVLASAPDAVSRPNVTWLVGRYDPATIAINKNATNLNTSSTVWSGFASLPLLANDGTFAAELF